MSPKKAKLYEEMIDGLKDKYDRLDKRCDKIQLLTALPKSLTLREIQEQFGTTQYIARKSKLLQEETLIFYSSWAKTGKIYKC